MSIDSWSVIILDDRPIGVFDSGLGGLAAVRALRALLPGEDVIYLGDTGRVPYGGRSRETIVRYALEDTSFLLRRNVKAILIACGTVSSNAVSEVRKAAGGIPVTGTVEPTAKAAADLSRGGRIGVIATAATIRSGAMGRAVLSLRPKAEILEKACPLFVPLVEDGRVQPGEPLITLCAREYLEPLRDAGVDTLILGCTHYPLISAVISSIMGPDVTLVDSAAAAAGAIAAALREKDMSASKTDGGRQQYFVTDSTERFSAVASLFLGANVDGAVQRVDITD